MQLEIIRDFQLYRSGVPVALAPSSQRLVAYLALQDHPVQRVRVGEVLWCDADPHRAAANLRSTLWRLPVRDVVASSSSHLWLAPSVSVDVDEVTRRALAVIGPASADGISLALARELIDAGDLLADWPEEWVMPERERFRQIRLQALDRIAEGMLDLGRCCDALQVALAVTQAEPLRESAHRVLIRVHLRQGNVSEAIREYRCYADLLEAELDGRPSPLMRGLLAPFVGSDRAIRTAGTGGGRLLPRRRRIAGTVRSVPTPPAPMRPVADGR
ncbi:MAG: BTAD domain-containing putative transcriptional regulator [Micropruina sp.]